MVRYGSIQFQFNKVQYSSIQFNTVQYSSIKFDISIKFYTVLYRSKWFNTAQCISVQIITVKCSLISSASSIQSNAVNYIERY